MKKLFGRDKPKITKVVPASRDSDAAEVEVDDLSPPLFAQKSDSEVSLHDLNAVASSPTPVHQRHSPPQHHTHPHHHTQPVRSLPQPHNHNRNNDPDDDDAAWHVVDPSSSPVLDPPRALPASRSSSLASLPPGASAPAAAVPSPLAPRANSPLNTQSHRQPNPKDQHFARDRGDSQASLAQLPPPQPPRRPTPGLNMLRSLEPQYESVRDKEREREQWRGTEESLNTQSDGSRDERDRKERKGFWDWAQQGMERERDRRLHREREKEREEEEHFELTRMIGAYHSYPYRSSLHAFSRLSHRDFE